MREVWRLVCAAAAVLAVATGMGDKVVEDAANSHAPAADPNTLSSILHDRQRILGISSTTTYTDVVMVTSTVFYSCLSGTKADVCAGRRRRRSQLTSANIDIVDKDLGGSGLESSLEDHQDTVAAGVTQDPRDPTNIKDEGDQDPSNKDKDPKLFLTIWTVSRSTSTVTMLFTDTSTTIRLSYFCQAGFQQLPSGCPGG